MLLSLNYSKNVFIEITNLDHGGLGWELGSCLWSPVFNKKGGKSWRTMETINIDDVVIHLVKLGKEYHWYGISEVESLVIETTTEPPKSDRWSDMAPYQRINLSNFNKLTQPISIQTIFQHFDKELRSILNANNYGQFYVEYFETLRVAQRYIVKCPESLFKIFNRFSETIRFDQIVKSNSYLPTLNEPQGPDYLPPGRIPTLVSRIVRDTVLSRAIKGEYKYTCQICGTWILMPNNNRYAEAHHLRPLGGEHNGPDLRENIIIVCPTHHAEFDYGSIAINPSNGIIYHIDNSNQYHQQKQAYIRQDLSAIYLEYHYKNRFGKV